MSYEGDMIKAIRRKNNYTQEEFSKETMIPRITIAQWESGKRTPPYYLIKLLVKVYMK